MVDSYGPDVYNMMGERAGNSSDVAVSGSRSGESLRGSSGDSSSDDDDDDSRDSNVFYDCKRSDGSDSSVSSNGDESNNSNNPAMEGPGGGVDVAHDLADDDVEILNSFAKV